MEYGPNKRSVTFCCWWLLLSTIRKLGRSLRSHAYCNRCVCHSGHRQDDSAFELMHEASLRAL